MNKEKQGRVLVFGQICLDIVPDLGDLPADKVISEGRLFEIGALRMRAGGGVGNTGTALLRLGADAHCTALIGDDAIGQLTIGAIEQATGKNIPGIQMLAGQTSSYTLVISPASHDRTLLYSPGVNNEFCADVIDDDVLKGMAIVHCAYPTVLRQFLEDGGTSLASVFKSAREHGALTSLDLTVPDPMALSGSIDWAHWLQTVLPYTDIFMPSIDEATAILKAPHANSLDNSDPTFPTIDLVNAYCAQFLSMGVHIAGIKLGSRGLMIETSANTHLRLGGLMDVNQAAQWSGVYIRQSAFDVTVNPAGTTGAGDCAYAGLLTAIAAGRSPHDALRIAAASGAACVESPLGAASLPSIQDLEHRIASGWQTRLQV
ncbi:MAG: carbohydrate kinase family protein [Pleurocapsa minor GSE-CHR-MK-17-07R]|jgi:sugar/nucleoside kinase (ribokinase family)|nr:carbohydrate kinase family protein [Pleurocapsa minor GSE-CHR-MK 17-07R]